MNYIRIEKHLKIKGVLTEKYKNVIMTQRRNNDRRYIMLENKKALIFDLDGTLADTLGAITEAINMTMTAYGLPVKDETEVRNAIGNGAKALIRRLVNTECGGDESKINKILECYDKMYSLTYLNTTEMYDGMRETIDILIKNGCLIAVLSNKPDGFVKGLAEQFFSNGEVAVARGQTDIPVKPDPTGVEIILKELGVSAEQCVFVGDSGVDLKTAQNSGMDFIGAGWGFWGKERLADAGASLIADTPIEILKILKI